MFELSEIANTFIDFFINMDPLELVATISGIICVYLLVKQNIWNWPLGLINVSILVYIFWEQKLYADMGLNAIYFPLGIYGWYNWLHPKENETVLPVTLMTNQLRATLLASGIVITFLMGYILDNYTDAELTYFDAMTTTFSLIAQWMLAKKFIENWILWIIVDVVAAAMYIYKDLYMISFLFVVYLILAVIGYVQWKKDIDANSEVKNNGGPKMMADF